MGCLSAISFRGRSKESQPDTRMIRRNKRELIIEDVIKTDESSVNEKKE
jgi:hypothetical protein